MQRWGNPDGIGFGRHAFGMTLSKERVFSGVRAGGGAPIGRGPGEFFRARITHMSFR